MYIKPGGFFFLNIDFWGYSSAAYNSPALPIVRATGFYNY